MSTASRKNAGITVDSAGDDTHSTSANRPWRRPTPEEIKRFSEENADFIKSWNDYIEKNGLPLRKYRAF